LRIIVIDRVEPVVVVGDRYVRTTLDAHYSFPVYAFPVHVCDAIQALNRRCCEVDERRWWDAGGTLMGPWWDAGGTLLGRCWDADETLMRRWWDAGGTLVGR
jgi:hypothetical protein